MTHPERWPDIETYADGALGPGKSAQLELHLRDCADCTARLDSTRRENNLLRSVLAPSPPPPYLTDQVLARVYGGQSKPRLRSAFSAGVLVNLATAAMLFGLSVNTGTSVALMLLVALIGAVGWGGLKGLLFGKLLQVLPEGVLARGVIFGLAVWAVTNALLGLTGGFEDDVSFSPTFVLLGSLLHHLLYGILLSWLYARMTSSMDRARS
ncbi:MAG: zf-HC2 domain-containing protein [Chloroflexota bacterium]|nr:zf-HC2 domain-containing protein [Chloroflexota bacterium]